MASPPGRSVPPPASSNRRLTLVLIGASLVMLGIDAGWALCIRWFGWHPGGSIFWISLGMYAVAGALGYECGGLLLSAVAGAVVCIVDNSLGVFLGWLLLPPRVAAALPSIPDMAPMFAEGVAMAIGLGLLGGGGAILLRRWRYRRIT